MQLVNWNLITTNENKNMKTRITLIVALTLPSIIARADVEADFWIEYQKSHLLGGRPPSDMYMADFALGQTNTIFAPQLQSERENDLINDVVSYTSTNQMDVVESSAATNSVAVSDETTEIETTEETETAKTPFNRLWLLALPVLFAVLLIYRCPCKAKCKTK